MAEEEEEQQKIRRNRNKPRNQTKKDLNQPPPILSDKKKKYFTSSRFRGLGCTTPAQVSVPAMIRTSANWEAKKVGRKMKKKNCISNSSYSSDESSDVRSGCLVVPDVWCGPGIGFSTDAVFAYVSDSVDCVASSSRRNNNNNRGKVDVDNTNITRQRGSYGGRKMLHPEDLPFFDTDSGIPHPHRSFGTRHLRHHRSPEGLAEIVRLQGNILLGGRLGHDRYRDWRLDVDSMSYEELLALGDKIGYVCTGLKEDEIRRCVRKTNPPVVSEDKSSSHIQTETQSKCTICQEEFEGDDEIGKLDCGHFYHMHCIKQWLGQKKTCPICKVMVKSQQ